MLFKDEETELEFNCSGNSIMQVGCQALESYCFDYGVQLTVEKAYPVSTVMTCSKNLTEEQLQFLCEKVNKQFKKKQGDFCTFDNGMGFSSFTVRVKDHNELTNLI